MYFDTIGKYLHKKQISIKRKLPLSLNWWYNAAFGNAFLFWSCSTSLSLKLNINHLSPSSFLSLILLYKNKPLILRFLVIQMKREQKKVIYPYWYELSTTKNHEFMQSFWYNWYRSGNCLNTSISSLNQNFCLTTWLQKRACFEWF